MDITLERILSLIPTKPDGKYIHGAKKEFCESIDAPVNIVSDWIEGRSKSYRSYLYAISAKYGVSVEWLKGETDEKNSPGVTESFVSYQILGEVAAGYEHYAYEDWTYGQVDVPLSWLKGRQKDDYFVLRITGDSMYPLYQNGDLVLVLRQPAIDRSGQIGVVMYEDDKATLKRIEFAPGEEWMKLSPVNPQYPPVIIRGEELAHCRVLGVPKMLIREIGL